MCPDPEIPKQPREAAHRGLSPRLKAHAHTARCTHWHSHPRIGAYPLKISSQKLKEKNSLSPFSFTKAS